ncbi:hypothetical protein DSL72_008007 [Monilinia vaccinii-corymbosi]|uniref:Uncharacterized protein n=1 Tax=Monilinia vaccinii-corymbosi TaxID=61207 RepID=A0A8A3PIN2_9HELO|nr:hypothetical protein DSL72_008007 [Monilinia vaccinii-corymbosi]
MANPNRQPTTPLEPLSRSLMTEERNSSVRHSPISRVTPSAARNLSNLPRPVSSLHTNVKNSSGAASYSRTRLGSQPVEHASSSARSHNTKDAPSKDRLIFGPSSRSNHKGETSASTARRIPLGSLGPASSSLPRTDKVKSSRLQPSPKKSSGPAPASSRRGQRGNLPFSLSSPNVNNLSISNENIPPVPFAPKSELHERILRGSTVNNNYYPHPLYSNPTVASSPLTASASSTDISQPRSRNQREAEREISRIPSPTSGSRSRPFSRRHLITPVRKVIEKGEESQARRNIPVAWRLPQIHPSMEFPPGPDQNQIQVPVVTPEPQLKAASLPKSRTFGVFATLKNSSSIQWLNSNRSASNPNRATEPIISTTKYSPIPEFTTNTLQIHTAQPSAYWCGRFQAVCDRYQTEDFNICVSSPLLYPNGGHFERENPASAYKAGGETIPETSSPLKCDSPALLLDKCRKKIPAKPSKTVLKFSTASISLEDFDKRALKVMVILSSLCCTGPAKKSFREWQVQYATAIKNKALMPKNDPDDRGFFGRVGRVISDGVTGNKNGTNGRGTGMGKRSAFGLRRSGRSVAGDN